MDVKIDEYGRIVIPKSVRDQLGLESGSSLELEVQSGSNDLASINLKPKGREPSLQKKGDLLVHTGKLTDESFDIVEDLRNRRNERAQRQAGRS